MLPPSADVTSLRVQSFDLVSRILKLLNWDESELETRDTQRHQGPRRKILTWQIMVGLIAHALPFAGRFSQCLRHFFGMTLSDSALSQRRAQLGADLFLLIMRETLRPLADEPLHPGCFFAGLRLLGIDGTRWSVGNTPRHLARIVKAQTRRGSAAFAKISMSALVAQERLAVAAEAEEAGGEVQAAGVVRISLSICLEQTQALWLVLSAAEGLMDEAAQRELVRRMRAQIAACALPPRRPRSCERRVRQPATKWPRMISPTSVTAPAVYEVTKIA